ncbi:OsmC family protein [Panacagrimonas perspica]|nr:OsmC family protein [Panacagrimonas perspica]
MTTTLQKNPGVAAKVVYKAQTRLLEGTRSTQCGVSVRKHTALLVDEPAELAGADTGPNPVELLLASLGTCQEITYCLFANVMGIELDSVTVDLKGQMDVRGLFGIDESIPPGFQKITFETRIVSNADAEDIQKLIRLVESRCPVMDTIHRPVDVSGSAFLNGEAISAA